MAGLYMANCGLWLVLSRRNDFSKAMKKSLLIWIWVLVCAGSTVGFGQRLTAAQSLTLVCKFPNGTAVRNRPVMVTHAGNFGPQNATGMLDNNGRVVLPLPVGIRSYTVTIPGMRVRNPNQIRDGVQQLVQISVRPEMDYEKERRRLLGIIKNLNNIISYLKKKLKAVTDTDVPRATRMAFEKTIQEYEKTVQDYREKLDAAQFDNDDKETKLGDAKEQLERVEKLFRTFQERAVFETIQSSELSCQGFIERQSLSLRFKIRYPDWIYIPIDSIPRKEIVIKISVEATLRKSSETLVGKDGLPYILKKIDCPTSEYVDATFFVNDQDAKQFTDDKEYRITLVQLTDDGERPFNLTFKLKPKEGCVATPKELGKAGLVGKAETTCQQMRVELWDSGYIDGDVVDLVNTTTGATLVPSLTLTKDPVSFQFSLVQGDNQIELTGLDAGNESYEVSAKARFYCETDKRPILFRNVATDQELGTTLSLTNRTRPVPSKKPVNETKARVIIRYQP